MNFLRGMGSGSAQPPAPPQHNFIMVNEGGSINSNDIFAGANRGRQDMGRSTQGTIQGQNQRGGATQQRGLGQGGIPPEIHNDGAMDDVRSQVTSPYQGGGGTKAQWERGGTKSQWEGGEGYISTSPTGDNNPSTPRRGGA